MSSLRTALAVLVLLFVAGATTLGAVATPVSAIPTTAIAIPTATPTPNATPTPYPTPTATPNATPTPIPTSTPVPTPTATPTPTPSNQTVVHTSEELQKAIYTAKPGETNLRNGWSLQNEALL